MSLIHEQIVRNTEVTGTITALNGTVEIPFEGKQSCAVVISGTWVGTLVVEASCNGGTSWTTVWVSAINQSPVSLGSPIPSTSITANGTYKVFNTSGVTLYRVRASLFTSGTVNVVLQVVNAPTSFIYTHGSIIQAAVVDSNNSSTANLTSGSSFTGTATSTSGASGIQVTLSADQNCMVCVEQSPDGTNWDIIDCFNYYYTINNFGITVQSVNAYVRVVVTNIDESTTTYFRLQTVLCPIVPSLPRSLDENGNLKVGIKSLEDRYGFSAEFTPNDEIRVITPFRVIGAIFSGTTLDTNSWTASTGTGGSATVGGAQVIISTGTTANNTVSLQSTENARYIGASSNRFRAVIRLPDTGTTNNTRRWGAFNTNDGCFFELSGTTFRIVTRKSGIDIPVNNGDFNGTWGATISLDIKVKIYEIYWNNSKVYFIYNGEVLHTVAADDTTWTSDLGLPIRVENNNSGDSTTNVSLNLRVATISRMGNATTQPKLYYQSGTTAGVVLKYGPGNLHALNVSGVNNNSVITLYDGTTTGGKIIYSTGTMASNAVPFSIPFYGSAYSTGLFITITGANSNATIAYE